MAESAHGLVRELPRPGEQLIEESRERMGRALRGRDRAISIALGGALVATAVAMAAALPWRTSASPLRALLLVALLAVLSRVRFEVGRGTGLATQLALVPMLLLLPAAIVPLCAAAGYLLGGSVDHLRGRLHPERAFVLLASTWHAVGPAALLVAAGEPRPGWSHWPLYCGAFAAQIALDFASTIARERLALDAPIGAVARCLAWVYLVDLLLAPIALFAVLESRRWSVAVVLVALLGVLLWMLARDRQTQIDRMLRLLGAYRTANDEARRDHLTGVGNRLAWQEALAAAQHGIAAGSAMCYSVVVLDVDGLKAVNDVHGHHVGDELLQAFAGLIRESVRETDVVARIGGDELGVLMPAVDEDACAAAVERLEDAIGRASLGDVRLSAAFGYASCPPAASLVDAGRLADRRMYERKRGGRGEAPVSLLACGD